MSEFHYSDAPCPHHGVGKACGDCLTAAFAQARAEMEAEKLENFRIRKTLSEVATEQSNRAEKAEAALRESPYMKLVHDDRVALLAQVSDLQAKLAAAERSEAIARERLVCEQADRVALRDARAELSAWKGRWEREAELHQQTMAQAAELRRALEDVLSIAGDSHNGCLSCDSQACETGKVLDKARNLLGWNAG